MKLSKEQSFTVKKYVLVIVISLLAVLMVLGTMNLNTIKNLLTPSQQDTTTAETLETQTIKEKGITAIVPASYKQRQSDSLSNFYEDDNGNLIVFYKNFATPSTGKDITEVIPELKQKSFDQSALDTASFLYEQGFNVRFVNLDGDDNGDNHKVNSETLVAMNNNTTDSFGAIRQETRPQNTVTIYIISHEGRVFGFDGNLEQATEVFSQFRFDE